MRLGTLLKKLALAVAIAMFAGTYVYTGNPIIEEIADYGSAGINSTDPCYQPNIFC